MNKLISILICIISLLSLSFLTIQQNDDPFQNDFKDFLEPQEEKTESQKYNEQYLETFFEKVIGKKEIDSNQIKQELENKDDLLKLKIQYKDHCLNGLKSEDLSEKQKLQAFVQGKCSPVILQPGIMGSALNVEINCEELQENEPEVFQSCGWRRCKRTWYNFFLGGFPKSEYRLWIPSLSQVTNMVSMTNKNKCFGNLIQLKKQVNKKEENQKIEWKSPKGVNVTFDSLTSKSKKSGQCGNSGVQNYAGTSFLNGLTCSLQGYKNLIELMNIMGYQPGLTYQSMPYDFRHAAEYSTFQQTFKKSLINLKKFTGKKSIIISHSYGVNQAYHALVNYTQDFKDEHINQWIPTGPPFSGVESSIKMMLNKSDDFLLAELGKIFGIKISIGVQYYSQKKLTEANSSVMDLFSKFTLNNPKFQNELWVKEILKRIEYENSNFNQDLLLEKDIPLDFFPRKDEICRPNETENPQNMKCQTGMANPQDYYLVKIQDEKFYLNYEDMDRLFQLHGMQDMHEQYKVSNQTIFEELYNPGVRVTNVYGTFLDVDNQYDYDESPKPFTEKDQFKFGKISNYIKGDGSVPSLSQLMGPIKWKLENDQNIKNSKPIRFIEMCSSYNNISNISLNQLQNWDDTYIGLECSCQSNNDYSNCKHNCMTGEIHYVGFLANIFSTSEISNFQNQMLPSSITDEDIYLQMVECNNLQL